MLQALIKHSPKHIDFAVTQTSQDMSSVIAQLSKSYKRNDVSLYRGPETTLDQFIATHPGLMKAINPKSINDHGVLPTK